MAQTIRDIARMAGVCIGTVSRVINNKDKVHPDTRRKILELIERNGYQPSVLGRNLVLRQTKNILLEMFNVSDPYCASVVKKITAHCRQRGYSTLTGDCDYDPAIEANYLQHAHDGHVDGMIVSPLPAPGNIPYYAELVHRQFPLVLMDNEVPQVKANCVLYDDYAGAKMAMEYLYAKGHRTIAFAGWQMDFATVKRRLAGYTDALIDRALTFRADLVLRAMANLDEWNAEAVMRALLRQPNPPTAILAESDIVAVVLMHALQKLGKRVTRDVAVLSFGAPAITALAPMPLTYISLHENEAVRQAAELLIELIEQPKSRKRPVRRIVVQPELVVGASA